MRALVYHGPQDVRYEAVTDPKIQGARDAIVRVEATGICGADLHVYNGLLPGAGPTIIGREFMGVVEEVGGSVSNLRRGDRVLVPATIACGRCWFCRNRLPAQCETSNPQRYGPEGGRVTGKGGGLFGYTELYGGYSGGHAEYVRVPFADFGPRRAPDALDDESIVLLADTLPSGWWAIDAATLAAGDTVAVFGCGPVGLMAMKSAWLQGAGRVIGIDLLQYRLDLARSAASAEVINANEQDAVQAVREMTLGRGADVCVDAAGMEADRSTLEKVSNAVRLQTGTVSALKTALSAVRRGGRVSVVGSYFSEYDRFPLGQVFDKGLTLRSGVAPIQDYTMHLIRIVENRSIRIDDIITHRVPLSRGAFAYRMFNGKLDRCVKVIMRPGG